MSTQLMPYGALTVFTKQWRCFIGLFLAVVLGGGAYLLFAEEKYESVAQLVITFGDRSTPEVDRSPATEMTPSDRREIVLSHAAILQSHDLARAAIEAFGLQTVYPDIVESPPSRGTPMDKAITTFLDSLSVEVGQQDNIITLSFRHPDKRLAPKLVQKLIDLYVSRQTEIYHNPHQDFLSTEVRQAGDRLAAAQTALEQFKSRWRITDYDKEVEDLLGQRGDLDTDLHTAKANLAQAQHRQAELQTLMRKVPEKLPESASSEKYRALDDARSRLADLRTKQSQMLATYTPDSPALSSLKAGIATAEAEVAARTAELNHRSTSVPNTVYQTLQTDYMRTAAEADSNSQPVRVLGEQIAAIDQRLGELRKNRGSFNDLMREHQIAEETYRALSLQFADARVKGNLNDQRISPAVVLSAPTEPYKAVRPRKLITLLSCVFGGALLAAGVALLREAFDDRFSTAEQVAFLLDLPVLASLERRTHRIPPEILALGGTSE
ncbi:GumC family protein [Telmatospirillum siberiense]|uniref:Polysaccharide chain length determinant N-terminal domain-containing protein n=1 Tax=Telmatospirillum siberiense TaxID=382514 RepID=A0A2N3PS45_9PROT|nr:hypothetical protein [Telmatospirillum siberiense]PKU23229.1 hypothetical protein CWS72_17545 [Telmatospirillum siberiense]